MNHDMHVATGMNMNQGGVDTNAGMTGEKGMPGSEIGGPNRDQSMRTHNGQNFATGADSGMETGMGYGNMEMRGDSIGYGVGHGMDMPGGNGFGMGNGMGGNDVGIGNNGYGMGNGMGGNTAGVGYGIGNGVGNVMGGNNMAGVDMRMYMGTIKRSESSKKRHNDSKKNVKTS